MPPLLKPRDGRVEGRGDGESAVERDVGEEHRRRDEAHAPAQVREDVRLGVLRRGAADDAPRDDAERLHRCEVPRTHDTLCDTMSTLVGTQTLDVHAKTNLHNFCTRKGLSFPRAVTQRINGRHILSFVLPGYPWCLALGCGRSIADAGRRAAMHALALLGAGCAFPEPAGHLYAYVHPDVFGVASWIPAVYFAGGPAVALVSRWIRTRA